MKKGMIVILCLMVLCLLPFVLKKDTIVQNVYTVQTQNQVFDIEEVYYPKTKGKDAHYLFKINGIFPIQVNAISKNKKVIEDVYYYEDEQFQCAYPVGSQLPKIDVLCYQNDIVYPYHLIRGQYSKIDSFVQSLRDYNLEPFEDEKKVYQEMNGITVYNSLPANHVIGVENYKGIILLNQKKIQTKSLFRTDQYQKDIEFFYNRYYLVADYNSQFEFHEFYVIDMSTGKEIQIISNDVISMDSYIQGVVDGKIYLLDRNYKKQYQIDISKRKVVKVGDTKRGVLMYVSGKWETDTMLNVLKKEMNFSNESILEKSIQEKYDKCDFVEDYAYCYLKKNFKYEVYRYHKQMPRVGYFITTLNDISKVQYVGDYIYWLDGDYIYYYHDLFGSHVVLKNAEFGFNNQLLFGVYVK